MFFESGFEQVLGGCRSYGCRYMYVVPDPRSDNRKGSSYELIIYNVIDPPLAKAGPPGAGFTRR